MGNSCWNLDNLLNNICGFRDKGTREMNANELADELDNWYSHSNENLWNEAATMLRQQQAEIESLKANFNKKNPVKEVFNNEPVAWIDSVGNITKQNLGNFKPLYTTPQIKELSDETLMRIYEVAEGDIPIDKYLQKCRAILRKAQEK